MYDFVVIRFWFVEFYAFYHTYIEVLQSAGVSSIMYLIIVYTQDCVILMYFNSFKA